MSEAAGYPIQASYPNLRFAVILGALLPLGSFCRRGLSIGGGLFACGSLLLLSIASRFFGVLASPFLARHVRVYRMWCV